LEGGQKRSLAHHGRRIKWLAAKPKQSSGKLSNLKSPRRDQPDDFISVARRLGADESKERFEKKRKKISKANPKKR
jgi:hypothetical protein